MAESPLRVLIVDDESPARHRLRELLDDCAAALPLAIIGEAQHGREALDILHTAPRRPRAHRHPHAGNGRHRARAAFAQAPASAGRDLHHGVSRARAAGFRRQRRRLPGEAGACTATAGRIAEGAAIEADDDREAHAAAGRGAALPVGHRALARRAGPGRRSHLSQGRAQVHHDPHRAARVPARGIADAARRGIRRALRSRPPQLPRRARLHPRFRAARRTTTAMRTGKCCSTASTNRCRCRAGSNTSFARSAARRSTARRRSGDGSAERPAIDGNASRRARPTRYVARHLSSAEAERASPCTACVNTPALHFAPRRLGASNLPGPDAHADLRLARVRHDHGVSRSFRAAHPARADARAVRRLPDQRHAPRMGRLRRQHRLQPARRSAASRWSWRPLGSDGGGYRERLRALGIATDGVRTCRRRVHGAGVHHHRPRRQPDHRVPSGRDELLAREPRRRRRATSGSASSRPTARKACCSTRAQFAAARHPVHLRSRARGCRCSTATELVCDDRAASYRRRQRLRSDSMLAERTGWSIAEIAERVDALIVTLGGEGSRDPRRRRDDARSPRVQADRGRRSDRLRRRLSRRAPVRHRAWLGLAAHAAASPRCWARSRSRAAAGRTMRWTATRSPRATTQAFGERPW